MGNDILSGTTPGPWKVEQQAGDEWWFGGRNGCQWVIYAGDKTYNSHAVLGGEYGDTEAEANARLIAAAPELAAENERLRKACEAAFDFLGGVDDASEVRDQLMRALAHSGDA
jgi:hypothetical protein